MTRLQHIALGARDLSAAHTFYCELLELSGRLGAENLWVNFHDGFVLRFDLSEGDFSPGAVRYLGLELPDFAAVDAMFAKLQGRVPVERDVRETYRRAQGPYGFFVRDPSGYLVKVFRYNEP